nr:response regulator [Lysobacter sp. CAU 1642]
MLVDDQPSRLLSYEAVLAELGENLVRAGSGREALARLMEMEFAVILLDVNMPDLDGFETASMIHQHPRHEKTPIIFVTAVHITDLDRLRGYHLGAVDYVFVPVVPEILRSKVSVLCELYRQRRELERLNRSLEKTNADLADANAALQAEKANELHALNQVLERTNRELAGTNATLQAEIAERRRAEERLRDADRRKDEFLATLAHELRNPLAPIRNALQLLRTGSPEVTGGALTVMERQLRQLVRLIDDLLDVARITRGKLEMRKRQIVLRTVLDDAIAAVRPVIDDARQTLEADLEAADVEVDADPERLTQVFANLLNNACKYSPPEARLSISARCEDGRAVVLVRDEGIGIPAPQLEQIFDLFVQADTSLERARGGLGIGLTLVRQLVHMHGGSVAAESAGGGLGSTFTVQLPLSAARPIGDTRSGEAIPAAQSSAMPSARRRVMVIDDNRDAADSLSMALRLSSHEVRVVYDPLKAREACALFRPEIVFMDVGMPGMNGYDLVRLLRGEPWAERALIIALTGWGQETDRQRSREAGFDHHLVKPADFEEIEMLCNAERREGGGVASGVAHG